MLELVWPGKVDAAIRATPVERFAEPCEWRPACGLNTANPQEIHSVSHRVYAGDNLDVLQWLRKGQEKYDVIYIDPPYNTGSHLTYSDKKTLRDSSSGGGSVAWLNEIYPRLLLARDLLHDHGVMFVSIDDNESCHLLTLMREIFGHENHLGTIKWRRKRKPSFLDKHMSSLFEYVLVFSRNARACPKLLGDPTEESTRPVLNATNKIVERHFPAHFPALCSDGIYPPGAYTNRSLTFELLDPLVIADGLVQTAARVRGPFRIQQKVWEETGYITRQFGLRRRVLAHEQKRRHAEDDGSGWPTNEDGQDELRAVFGDVRVFDFPKPVGLLSRLLSMVPPLDKARPQRCLDFYAGSGSLLIAALEQSRLDHIERQVDLVQSREKVLKGALDRYSDIAEICAHRVLLDSQLRGFSPSFHFLQMQQQE
ncbi:MAG: DNA methyltransferase [Silvanigrellaceae bacterium]